MASREWVATGGQGDVPMRQTGGSATIEDLYDRLIRDIYRFIYAKVGNREEAEDLTSQVFVKAMQGIDGSRPFESMRAWIFQVARTTVTDHWRIFYAAHVESLDRLLDFGWDGPAAGLQTQRGPDLEERVRALLARLPTRYRDVLTYRFLLNFTVRETAERMGLSETNAKVLQLRALRRAAELERAAAPPG